MLNTVISDDVNKTSIALVVCLLHFFVLFVLLSIFIFSISHSGICVFTASDVSIPVTSMLQQ